MLIAAGACIVGLASVAQSSHPPPHHHHYPPSIPHDLHAFDWVTGISADQDGDLGKSDAFEGVRWQGGVGAEGLGVEGQGSGGAHTQWLGSAHVQGGVGVFGEERQNDSSGGGGGGAQHSAHSALPPVTHWLVQGLHSILHKGSSVGGEAGGGGGGGGGGVSSSSSSSSSSSGRGGSPRASAIPLLGNGLVVLAQLFAAMQVCVVLCLCVCVCVCQCASVSVVKVVCDSVRLCVCVCMCVCVCVCV